MADLVVGLSKTAVQGTLALVQSAIEEDARLQRSAQHDLVFISLEFEMIQSFLKVADNEISAKNNMVITWVRHVRELAYDLEDCIEFVISLDGKPVFWPRLLPACMVTTPLLDVAARELEYIKARAEELSKCYLRYSNITDSAGSKLVMMQQQTSLAAAATALNMLAKARDATKRRQGLVDLTHLISNSKPRPELQVISVWGTGGDHGMTPIIRKTYNDPQICQNFACRAWVKLMHPFNRRDFVRRFMAQVYADASNSKQGADVGAYVLRKIEAEQEDLLNEFVKEVNTKTYLVVLENLGDMVDWDAVRLFLPDMKNGSWIIVATEQFDIANMCVGHSYRALELKQFSAEHSVCALFKEDSQDYRAIEKSSMVYNVSKSFSKEVIPSSVKESAGALLRSDPLTGRESQMNEIRKYTARACLSISHVISVWGIPGIGKSALVRNLYIDNMIHSNLFGKYSWVDVSHPFNLRDFCRSLLLDFHSERDPIKDCQELLRQCQCLIVIDGLQSKEEWDLIQSALLSSHSRSVIIVITTEASVATYCTNEQNVFNVRGLETAAAIDLFVDEVRRNNSSSPLIGNKRPELKELILKCGGLPQVIVSVAGFLAATQESSTMNTVCSLSHKFMHHLENDLVYESLQGLFGWIHSYLRTTPDSLKPCIFYLSIFSRDRIIRRRRLIRRWTAEGYTQDKDDKSAEERGDEFFSQLIDLSIMQYPQVEPATTAWSGTRMTLCQVNGFIHEYIISRQVEENLVCELGDWCTPRTGRHLVILGSWYRDKIAFMSMNLSRVRSLTVMGQWKLFFVFADYRQLRVLDLEDAYGITDVDVECIVNILCGLKFLSLRGQLDIRHLPSSLGNLRQLQTLDIRGTSIRSLPKTITKIQKLQYVRAGSKHQSIGVEVPTRIRRLTGLHTLGVVNASGGNAIIREFKTLTQLRKLGVTGINEKNHMNFICAMSHLCHLESLTVWFDKGNQGWFGDLCLCSENLKSLKLYGLGDNFPQFRSQCRSLGKLDLEMDTLKENDIQFLSNLPRLCILRLRLKQLDDGMLDFSAMTCEEEMLTFEKLKILEIACSSSSLNVTFGPESMKNLELLTFDYSSNVSYQFSGLNDLHEVKTVLLKGTSDEMIKTQVQSELAKHPNTPAVKLEAV